MDITRPHTLTTTTVPTEQTSVKPLPGSRIALGGGKNSLQRNNLSDYLDTAEDFEDAEQVTGSFVGVYTDDTQREYAIVDLDDGRKTRVLKRYFRRFGEQSFQMQPGDRLTLFKRTYSEKSGHTCWEVAAMPLHIMSALPAAIREKLVEAPLHKPHWLELDTDFDCGVEEEGRIVRMVGPKSAPIYAIVEFSDGAATRVSATSFRLSGKDIRAYQPEDTLRLKKLGFIPGDNLTKWQVI